MLKPPPVRKRKCKTCPFREDGKGWKHLQSYLSEQSFQEGRFCHNTGKDCVGTMELEEEHICRGSRDLQLQFFVAIGFLEEATDECWSKKVDEINRSSLTTKERTSH